MPCVYGAPKYVSHVSRWASKWTSATRPALLVHRAKHRQGDRVIAADRHHVAGRVEHVVNGRLDLSDGLPDVERVARDVSGVRDLLDVERFDVEAGVARTEQPGRLAHGLGPEAGARPVRDTRVEGDPEYRDRSRAQPPLAMAAERRLGAPRIEVPDAHQRGRPVLADPPRPCCLSVKTGRTLGQLAAHPRFEGKIWSPGRKGFVSSPSASCWKRLTSG